MNVLKCIEHRLSLGLDLTEYRGFLFLKMASLKGFALDIATVQNKPSVVAITRRKKGITFALEWHCEDNL